MCPKVCTSAQADDEDLDALLKALKKLTEVLGHHQSGCQGAKKRFEAVIGG